MRLRTAFALFLAVTALPTAAQTFTDVTAQVGIDHVHTDPNLMGGGVALFDYDADGDLDIYLTGGRVRDVLYRNDGSGNFEEVGAAAGLAVTADAPTMGVVAADIDNDGFRDILLTTQRGGRTLLLHNQGDGTFADITATAGFDDANVFSASATSGDVNLDGLVDFYVTGYIEEPNAIRDEDGNGIGFAHGCFPDALFINNGDGTFTDRAATYGLDETGCGLVATFSDYDADADPDLFVVNDFGAWVEPNGLLRNEILSDDPRSLFTDLSDPMGAAVEIYGMGIAPGDFDSDGDLDYYMTNLGANVLLEKGANGFTDVAQACGVLNERTTPELFSTSWGTAFDDLDHDGDLDLLVANGHMPSFDFLANDVLAPDKFYRNEGDGTFTDVSDVSGFASTAVMRGLATGDLDGDGDLDAVVVAVAADGTGTDRTIVYRNDAASGHWLAVRLEGTTATRDGVGARVEAFADGRQWIREMDGGSSYLSHSARPVHFGLGTTAALDSVVVTWPGGQRDVISDVAADQTLAVQQRTTTSSSDGPARSALQVMAPRPNPSRGVTWIPYRASAPVTLRVYDALGRLVSTARSTEHVGELMWTGSDDGGRPLADGVYLYTLASGSETVHGRLTLLR